MTFLFCWKSSNKTINWHLQSLLEFQKKVISTSPMSSVCISRLYIYFCTIFPFLAYCEISGGIPLKPVQLLQLIAHNVLLLAIKWKKKSISIQWKFKNGKSKSETETGVLQICKFKCVKIGVATYVPPIKN